MEKVTDKTRIEILVDRAIMLDRKAKDTAKELNEVKAEIQYLGLEEMENKNTKYTSYFGDDGNVKISYRQKMEIDNVPMLREIFGDLLDDKLTRKEEIKYDLESKFKDALIAIYMGEYQDGNISDILDQMSLDENQKKLATKKLKGDYFKDKAIFESIGITGSLEEELDAIRDIKNYELIEKFIDTRKYSLPAIKEQLKRAISVEETLSIGLDYEK